MSDLARKTAKNALWSYSAFVLGKGVVFVTTVILARLLDPSDFGLLALATIATNYLDVLSNFGVGSAFVYRQGDANRNANAAFTLSLSSGLLLTTAGLLVAPWVSSFFNEPELTPILRVLAMMYLVYSLGAIHEAKLRKDLKFRQLMIPQIAKAVVKGIVSIGLALSGFGVWSLIWGQVASAITSTVLYIAILRWMPRPSRDWEAIRALLSYGVQMILLSFIAEIDKNIDYILVGKRMDSRQLGFYSLAFRLPDLLIMNVVVVVGQAIFPTFARLQNDPNALRQGFLTTLRFISLIVFPLSLGMVLIAPEFVHIFYTDRWAAAIPVMQILSLYALVYSLSYNAGDLYKAIGRPGILNQQALLKIAMTIPILWYASQQNILYVAWGQFLAAGLITILRLWIAARMLKTGIHPIWLAMREAVICGSIMVIGTLAVRSQMLEFGSAFRLAMMILSGAVLYLGTLWWVGRDTIMLAVTMLRPARPKPPVDKMGGQLPATQE